MAKSAAVVVVAYLVSLWINSACCYYLNDSNVTRTDVLHRLLENYDAKLPPNFNVDQSLSVICSVYVNGMSNLDEKAMDYSVIIFMREKWKDTRLRYGHLVNVTYLTMDSHMLDKIWLPDMFFINAKKDSVHDRTKPISVLRLYPDGHVYSSVRVSLTLDCPMDLHSFPLDSQICDVDISTFAFDKEKLTLKWDNNKPFEISPHLKLSQFLLVDTSLSTGVTSFNTGNFSSLHIHFLLRRDFGYYLIQTYIPSGLIVLLSWVGFWIDANSVPARISLGVTTVLTITTQTAVVEARLPKVSYIKAMDIWMAVCSIFVFGALLEFAIVNVQIRKETKVKARLSLRRTRSVSDSEDEDNRKHKDARARGRCEARSHCCQITHYLAGTTSEYENNMTIFGCAHVRWTAYTVDRFSRRLFPVIFVVFNIFYWIIYLNAGSSVMLPS